MKKQALQRVLEGIFQTDIKNKKDVVDYIEIGMNRVKSEELEDDDRKNYGAFFETVIGIQEGEYPYYKIGQELFNGLKKVDLNIPVGVIPDKLVCFIEFPEYLNLMPDTHKDEFLSNNVILLISDNVLYCIYAVIRNDGKYALNHMAMALGGKITMSDLFGDNWKLTGATEIYAKDGYYNYKNFLATSLKCLAYICSQNPDLEFEKAPENKRKNPKKRIDFYKKNPMFNVTLVGKSFHGVTYHTDQWGVSGHFRWQPCGPQRKQIKLMWIKDHVKTRKNLHST